MGWTKGQLVRAAFSQLGLASYDFDLTPEEIQDAIRTMDSMMAVWDGQGISLGYQLNTNPDSPDPEQESGLPANANQAVFMNVAMQIAASYGKTPARTTAIAAKQGYDQLLSKYMAQNVVPMQMPGTMPAGAGNKWRGRGQFWPFLNHPRDPITAGENGVISYD